MLHVLLESCCGAKRTRNIIQVQAQYLPNSRLMASESHMSLCNVDCRLCTLHTERAVAVLPDLDLEEMHLFISLSP